MRTIPVRDANGDEFTVYEIWDRPRLFGLIADRRLTLCTGEPVQPIGDGKGFIVAGTGEKLVRIKGG